MRYDLISLVSLSMITASCATTEGDPQRSGANQGMTLQMAKSPGASSPMMNNSESNPYNGTWHVDLKSRQGASLNGEVVVRNQAGTWQMSVTGTDNACVGIPTPIAIQLATAEELVFETHGSKALRGCADGLVTLKRMNETTLQGELKIGPEFKLKLTKK